MIFYAKSQQTKTKKNETASFFFLTSRQLLQSKSSRRSFAVSGCFSPDGPNNSVAPFDTVHVGHTAASEETLEKSLSHDGGT